MRRFDLRLLCVCGVVGKSYTGPAQVRRQVWSVRYQGELWGIWEIMVVAAGSEMRARYVMCDIR